MPQSGPFEGVGLDGLVARGLGLGGQFFGIVRRDALIPGILDMGVEGHPVPHRPAEKLVDGNAQHFASNVPQGDVYGADDVGDVATAVDGAVEVEDALPDLLDVGRVLPDDNGLDRFDALHEHGCSAVVGTLAQSRHTLIGMHFDEDPRQALHGHGHVGLEVGDLHCLLPSACCRPDYVLSGFLRATIVIRSSWGSASVSPKEDKNSTS